MAYCVEIGPAAERQFKKLDITMARRLRDAINKLGANPRPPNSVMLSGPERNWRIRVGNYRVIYEIHDDRLVVLVIQVGHRREVYR
jgi:mRNA interferase RelE/StbE